MLEVRRVFPMISDNGLPCSEPFKQYVEFMTIKGPPQMAWIVSREMTGLTGHRLLPWDCLRRDVQYTNIRF